MAEQPVDGRVFCAGCSWQIDPFICGCGNPYEGHDDIAEDGASPMFGHTFVPAGCSCLRGLPRRGDWIQTYTGRKFYHFDPRPGDFDIEDIAHALSMICRFGGHCHTFYSVAQHSVLVSTILPNRYALAGLLHDAAEAYVGDMTWPLKRAEEMLSYRGIEAAIEAQIAIRFSIEDVVGNLAIRVADNMLLATEHRDLFRDILAWAPLPFPLPDPIQPQTPAMAYRSFMDRYESLMEHRQ